MKPFPRFRTLTNQVPQVDITKDIDSIQKCATPSKHAKRKICTNNISNDISTEKRYALLTNQTDNVDFFTEYVTEKGATSRIHDADEAETINNYQKVQSK